MQFSVWHLYCILPPQLQLIIDQPDHFSSVIASGFISKDPKIHILRRGTGNVFIRRGADKMHTHFVEDLSPHDSNVELLYVAEVLVGKRYCWA